MGVWTHLRVIKTALGLTGQAVMGDGALLNTANGKALPYHQITMSRGEREERGERESM